MSDARGNIYFPIRHATVWIDSRGTSLVHRCPLIVLTYTNMKLIYLCAVCSLISFSSSCQEPWSIESPMIKPGTFVTFKNKSSSSGSESLKWTWVGVNGEEWENTLWFTRDRAIYGGGFVFKKNKRSKGGFVTLNWEKQGDQVTWVHDPVMIKQPSWKITVRDVLEMNFISFETDWTFEVGDVQIHGTGDQNKFEKQEPTSSRRKRSEDIPDSSVVPEQAGFMDWMTNLWNYIFGSSTSRDDNQSEGLLSRFGNWLRGISCSFHGPCDTPVPGNPPEGPFPSSVTLPPVNSQVTPTSPGEFDVELAQEPNDVK